MNETHKPRVVSYLRNSPNEVLEASSNHKLNQAQNPSFNPLDSFAQTTQTCCSSLKPNHLDP